MPDFSAIAAEVSAMVQRAVEAAVAPLEARIAELEQAEAPAIVAPAPVVTIMPAPPRAPVAWEVARNSKGDLIGFSPVPVK